MTAPLTLTADLLDDGTRVLAAAGEIDMNNCADLDAAIGAALADGRARIVVDLSAVVYLDSAALGILFGRAEHIEVVANRMIAPVLTMTGLVDIMPVRGLDSPPPPT